MNIGDTVKDARGTAWQVTVSYGRSLWARTWGLHASDGTDALLHRPLRAAELGGDNRLAAACTDISREQARALGGDTPALASLISMVDVDGQSCLLSVRRGTPWREWVTQGQTTLAILNASANLTRAILEMGSLISVHGEISPESVWVGERGAITLTDPATPTTRRHQPELHAAAGSTGRPWRAPELRGATAPLPLSTSSDTYAIGMLLYQALCSGQERAPELPAEGLDKAARVALQDRIINRLKGEPANPRFHARLSERLSSTLNRALSRETSPSPPYRFRQLEEFAARLDEIAAMVHPTIAQAGRINFDLRAGDDSFSSDQEVGFTCSVACSPGVDSHEEVACGIAVFDADSATRVREVQAGYAVDRHPSGRFRFRFKLQGLIPRAYKVRIAFTIRDSGDEPVTVEGPFLVRAAPGYVPPRPAPAPAIPLSMEREPKTAVTEPGVKPKTETPSLVRPIDRNARTARAARPVVEPAPLPPLQSATALVDEAPTVDVAPKPIAPARAVPEPVPTTPRRASVIGLAAVQPVRATQDVQPGPPPIRASIGAEAPIGRRSSSPGISVAPTLDEPPDPADLPESEPDFSGAGRWSRLPLPKAPRIAEAVEEEDEPTSRPSSSYTDDEEQGPIGAMVQRAVDLVRGDTYVLLVGALGTAILVLALVLVMLRQGG